MTNAERLIRSAQASLTAAHDVLPTDAKVSRVAVLRALDALDDALTALPPE